MIIINTIIINIRQRFIFHYLLCWTLSEQQPWLWHSQVQFFGIPRIRRTQRVTLLCPLSLGKMTPKPIQNGVGTTLILLWKHAQGFKTLALRMSSYWVSNLPCLLHLVRARPCPGKWDSFLVAQGRKLTCPPAEEAVAQVIHYLSGNCCIQQPFIEHLLCVRCSLGHFIALDIYFLLRSSQQLYSLGFGGGHGPCMMDEGIDSQSSYVSYSKSKDSEVQMQVFWLQTHVFPVPPCSTLSALGPYPSLWRWHICIQPLPAAVPLKAPYSGWILRIPHWKRGA